MADMETRGWMPIETAPRDGTWVLVYDPKGVPDYMGLDEHEFYNAPLVHVLMARWDETEWIACFGEPRGSVCDGDYAVWLGTITTKPTHWMPLPQPPEAEK